MKHGGEAELLPPLAAVCITLSAEMCAPPFACKCNCHFPACQPPTGRTVALEGQPALSEKTLNTCDSLLSNQQREDAEEDGGGGGGGRERRDQGGSGKQK